MSAERIVQSALTTLALSEMAHDGETLGARTLTEDMTKYEIVSGFTLVTQYLLGWLAESNGLTREQAADHVRAHISEHVGVN